MGLGATKPVFRVSDKGRLKPVSSATSKKSEISPEASFDMILPNKQITKVLIRLTEAQAGMHLCCLQTPENRFSRAKAQIK